MSTEDKPITLTPDQKEYLLGTIKELCSAHSFLHEMIEKGVLKYEIVESVLSLSENYIAQMSKVLKYDSDSEAKIEERSSKIRQANEQIRELKRQLGESKPIEGLPEQLQFLATKVKDFWSQQDFNYIKEFSFSEYGNLQVTFAFSIGRFLSRSRTPVSDRKKKEDIVEDIKQRGFIIEKDDSNYELVLCDHNINLLTTLLQKRFPSIKIFKFDTMSFYNSDKHSINSIQAMIYDLKDILE